MRGGQVEGLKPRESQKIIGDVNKLSALRLQSLYAFERSPFALVARLLKVLGKELKIQAQRAQVIFDLMTETPSKLRQLGVAVGSAAAAGKC
jgi:hypothetical protein